MSLNKKLGNNVSRNNYFNTDNLTKNNNINNIKMNTEAYDNKSVKSWVSYNSKKS